MALLSYCLILNKLSVKVQGFLKKLHVEGATLRRELDEQLKYGEIAFKLPGVDPRAVLTPLDRFCFKKAFVDRIA